MGRISLIGCQERCNHCVKVGGQSSISMRNSEYPQLQFWHRSFDKHDQQEQTKLSAERVSNELYHPDYRHIYDNHFGRFR